MELLDMDIVWYTYGVVGYVCLLAFWRVVVGTVYTIIIGEHSLYVYVLGLETASCCVSMYATSDDFQGTTQIPCCGLCGGLAGL